MAVAVNRTSRRCESAVGWRTGGDYIADWRLLRSRRRLRSKTVISHAMRQSPWH